MAHRIFVDSLLLVAWALAGCSMSANQYAVHPDTITALLSHVGVSVKLAKFTSDKPGKSEIICRGGVMIQTPQGVSFEKYVEDAFRTELLVAGLESPSAPVTLSGHMERMHFVTFSDASWELRVTLASSTGAASRSPIITRLTGTSTATTRAARPRPRWRRPCSRWCARR